MSFDSSGLLPADDAVGRAEERTVDELVCLGDVCHVVRGGCLHALQVVHSVIAHAVAATTHLLKQLGMTSDIVAYHEECRLDAVSVEDVEYPRRLFGYRSVIEGQIYDFATSVAFDAPCRFREEQTVEQWRLFD
jgi:hypothetical protein